MNMLWGMILIIFTLLLAWLGQTINAFSPKLAVKLGLNEPETDVDPVFFTDSRGEAIWDVLILWPLPVAGLLMIFNNPLWAYFGLVGGGIYLYFAGRGIVVRLVMQHRGIRVGKPATLILAYTLLTIWGLIGAVTIFLAAKALSLS